MSSALDSYTASTMVGTLFGIVLTYSVVLLIVYVIEIIAWWKLFSKAGEAGWKALIPIYNLVILFKISGISGWLVLGYLLAGIPVVGWIISLAITIYAMYKLSQAFGKEPVYTVGLVLLQPIFIMILAFGSSQYQLNRTQM